MTELDEFVEHYSGLQNFGTKVIVVPNAEGHVYLTLAYHC